MSKIALLVVYNHRYDKNIPIIENLYAGKFSHLYHVIPFYEGDKENVLPVYESSYRFQSYIAQAYRQILLKCDDYTHYFVVADDMLLNPAVNEHNLFEFINIERDTCFITNFTDIQTQMTPWALFYEPFFYSIEQRRGIEIKNVLPDRETAISRFITCNIDVSVIPYRRLVDCALTYLKNGWRKRFARAVFDCIRLISKKRRAMNYPLVFGYSDILLLHRDMMKKFCTYCGAFAASDLFVEYAIPTSLVLAANKIATRENISKRTVMMGIHSDSQKYAEVTNPFSNDLNLLINQYPADVFFIHPVKLSKWK
jgi:hypothetical protein